MPVADFCAGHPRPSPGGQSRVRDPAQISRGKLDRRPRTTAGFTFCALDGYGLRGHMPARPTLTPRIRFLSIGPRVCSPLPSDGPSRGRPCGSPSGAGGLHPGALTEPDVSLATYPARATPAGLPACHHHLRAPPVAGWPYGAVWVTHPLRSLGVTPVHRYYEVVRPSSAHRYFRPRGTTAWAFSLRIAGKVLKFRTRARMRVTPLEHRTPPGQSVGPCQAAPGTGSPPRF